MLFNFMNLSLFLLAVCVDSESLVGKYPKLLFYIYGFLYSKLVGHVQISFLGQFQFAQSRISCFLCSIGLPLAMLLHKVDM